MDDFDDSDPPVSSSKETFDNRHILIHELEVCIRRVCVFDFDNDDEPCARIDEKSIGLRVIDSPRKGAQRISKPRRGHEVCMLFSEESKHLSLITQSNSLRALRPRRSNEAWSAEQNRCGKNIILRQPQEAAHLWLPSYKSYEPFPEYLELIRAFHFA